MIRFPLLGTLLASLMFIFANAIGANPDPTAEAPASRSLVATASKIAEAAVVYRRAYGEWPQQPAQLCAKLDHQPDLSPLENLQFLTMDDDETFVMTFSIGGKDYNVVKFLDENPVTPTEAKQYATSNFRIRLK